MSVAHAGTSGTLVQVEHKGQCQGKRTVKVDRAGPDREDSVLS
jgi:hypothetical protein